MEPTKTVHLLVCAATAREVDAFGPAAGGVVPAVTGVGIPATFRHLSPLVARLRPRRILNIGIAGAYPGSGLAIGDIVIGSEETYGDVGFEVPEPPGFRPIAEAGFTDVVYVDGLPLSRDPGWNRAGDGFTVGLGRGSTVNTCTGTNATGALRARLLGAAFETMEGAAVAQIGQDAGIPVCEVRAISNIAGERDMRPENIARALDILTRYLHACRQAGE